MTLRTTAVAVSTASSAPSLPLSSLPSSVLISFYVPSPVQRSSDFNPSNCCLNTRERIPFTAAVRIRRHISSPAAAPRTKQKRRNFLNKVGKGYLTHFLSSQVRRCSFDLPPLSPESANGRARSSPGILCSHSYGQTVTAALSEELAAKTSFLLFFCFQLISFRLPVLAFRFPIFAFLFPSHNFLQLHFDFFFFRL